MLLKMQLIVMQSFVLGFASICAATAADGGGVENVFKFEVGDPQNCPQSTANILEVLPSYGWDNLRNLAMGSVVALNYSKCKITPDRKYLIPDDMYVVPLKKSNVEIFSQLFDHFSNYTSMTSETINVEAHASFGFFGKISASFSKSYQNTKKYQVNDKAVSSRVQLRYVYYTVKSQPDPQLQPVFRERLLDIAASIQMNDTERTEYLVDLLVRDYGTHYVTGIDAGAVIAQEDQLNSSFVYDYQGHKSMITAAASADFSFNIGFPLGIGGGGSYTKTASDALINQYITNRTHSKIVSYGGPPFRANFTLNDWVDGLSNNLVAVDRSGDPLYYVITPNTLPELPILTIRDLTSSVQKGVERYYQYNVYRGCTDVDKPNFSFIANFDDGSCKGPNTNFTFGGVYQTCTGGLCSRDLSQVNPKTQEYSCPTDYEKVLLYEGTKVQCVRKCKRHWWFRYDCYDDCSATATSPNAAHYEAYWCAATHPVDKDSGYLFGGVYTSTTTNPLTRASSCPIHFTALKLGKNIHVCVSDDYELGFRYSVPFAGFFSCKSGNPLAIPGEPLHKPQLERSEMKTLAAFVMASGSASWPKKCPDGYSQHLVTINEGCEINYCVKANILSDHELPVIRRPPFQIHPERLENATRTLITSSGNIFMKTENHKQWTKTDMIQLEMALNPTLGKDSLGSSPESNSTGVTVGVTIGTTTLIGLVIALALVGYKRRKLREQSPNALIANADGSYNTFNEVSNSNV